MATSKRFFGLILLFLALSVGRLSAQCGTIVLNVFTGQFDCTGAFSAATGVITSSPTLNAVPYWTGTGNTLGNSSASYNPSTGQYSFNAGLIWAPVTVAFNAGSPVLNLANGAIFNLTLTGNATATASNAAVGSVFIVRISQDGSGNHTFSWPSGFSQACAVDPTASVSTTQMFFWDGSNADPMGPCITSESPFVAFGAERAAPGSPPPSGFQFLWFDSTWHGPCATSSTGQVYCMVTVSDLAGDYTGTSLTVTGTGTFGSGSAASGQISESDANNANTWTLTNVLGATAWQLAAANTLTFQGTAPGSQAGNGTGSGNWFNVTPPNGGATSSTGANTGGNGGVFVFTGGTGGAATGAGTSSTVGGKGGDFSITTGTGGAGQAGNDSGGNGGDVLLNTGPGGSKTGSGTAGNSGRFLFEQNGQLWTTVSGAGGLTINAGSNVGTTQLSSSTNPASATGTTLGALTVNGGDQGTGSTGSGTAGSATIRGGNHGGTGTAITAGNLTVQGGDATGASTSGTTTAGSLTIRPGMATSTGGSTIVQGNAKYQIAGVKDTTANAGNLACATSTGKVGDCGSTATNPAYIGIIDSISGGAVIINVLGGQVTVNSASATWTVGHTVCTDTGNAAKAVDSGGTAACATGVRVGTVAVTDGGNVTSHSIWMSH